MKKNLAMVSYLKTLYVSPSMRLSYENLMKFLNQTEVRDIKPIDEGRTAVPMLIVYTAGRGVRSSFKGYGFARVDFQKVSDSYCEAFIKEADAAGYPKRLFNRSNRYAVII